MYNGVNQLYSNPYAPQIIRKPLKKAAKPDNSSVEKKIQEKSSSVSADEQKQQSATGNERKNAIDYSSSVIKIEQILIDFKNTLNAIGAPKEIEKEVIGYLELVDVQSKKANPSVNIIKSNLVNASNVLDTFISETLGKPSDVVNNWVKALFLQHVDWKSQAKPAQEIKVKPEEKIVPHSYEDLLEDTQALSQDKIEVDLKSQITERKSDIGESAPVEIAQSPELQAEKNELSKLYKQLESLVDKGEFEKAVQGYEKALQVARNIGDLKTEANIYMDLAYIYDIENNLPLSLEYYNSAALTAKAIPDMELQSKAHYNMGTIYDDVGKIDLALQHYFAALGLDGETENLKGQSLTLNNIGNMFAVKGDYKKSLNYYKVAYSLVSQLDDNIGKSSVLSNVAGVFRDLGYDKKALENYGKAVQIDVLAGNISGYAKSYEQSGDIMLKLGQKEKAEKLYKKSLNAAVQIGDKFWAGRMMEKLSFIS